MMKNNNKGYTLLFAVIISSLVLAVGISILSISKKEFSLSSSARESAYAFYAADTGLECALYHDDGRFSTSTGGGGINVECGDDDFTGNVNIDVDRNVDNDTGFGTFTFYVKTNTGTSDTSCAQVIVQKKYVEYDESGPTVLIPQTIIESRGYNVGWNEIGPQQVQGDCTGTSPKKVERGMRVTY